MKIKKLVDSFNHAIEGIIHAIRTQLNIRIEFIFALLVLTICFFTDLSKVEFLIITITITMVIAAELINTAIESVIDLYVNYYHPLAKIAKDAAAGAVLVTSINAVIVGFVVFWNKLKPGTNHLITVVKNSNPYMIFTILIIVCILTLIVKAKFGEGTPLRGGMPSGHSVIAFSIATMITFISPEIEVVVLSYLLAVIVAQSRVDSEVHSVFEVVVGAIFGILLTIILFKLFR